MGKTAYMDMSERFAITFPDYQWDIIHFISSGKHVAIECIEKGTFTQPWATGGITIQPTGTSYTDRTCVFIDIDGLIAAYRYFGGNGFAKAYQEQLRELASGQWE